MKHLFLLIPLFIFSCKEDEPVSLKHVPKLDIGVVFNYSEKEQDAVIIENISSNDVDLSGYTLGNRANLNAYTFPANTIIEFNDLKKFTYNDFKFEIMNDDSTEIVILKNPDGEIEDIWRFK